MDHGPDVTEVMATAGAAILDGEGRILLGRRRDDGHWCLPGGRLEPGESFAECALRECREELGADVVLDALVAVLSSPATQLHRYPDGRTVHFVGVVFRGRLDSELGLGDGEFTATRWFSRPDLGGVEVMEADLPAIHHALSRYDTPLID